MPELRKDYILDSWVIIATERGKRPNDFKIEKKESKEEECYFCPGNEKYTPGEILRINKNNKWHMRVFLNKFPAVKTEGDFHIKTHNEFYTFADAYGCHEVIVETPSSKKQLWDLTIEDIKLLLDIYKQRIEDISKKEGIKYVQVFKNHDHEAGTSIKHSHSQIIAYNNIPKKVQDEINASKNYSSCPYCNIIQKEKDSYRRCFENNNFIAFTPYASRFPFEIIVLSKQHLKSLHECSLEDLASIMKQILIKLKELNAPYNFMIHYSPKYEDNLHFHIEFIPRLTTWAGFEYSGTIINPMPPEEAAKFYRGD